MKRDALHIDTQHPGHRLPRTRGGLRADPYFRPVARFIDRGHRVERFHLRVIDMIGEEVGLVPFGGLLERRSGIALFRNRAHLGTIASWNLGILDERGFAIEGLCRGSLRPINVQNVARLDHRLDGFPDHSDSVLQLHRRRNAWHRADLGLVVRRRTPVVHRGSGDHAIEHARHVHVQRIPGASIRLRRNVVARNGMPDESKIAGRL